jgi:hypothetical protein
MPGGFRTSSYGQRIALAKVEHLMRLCDAHDAILHRAEDQAAKLVEAVVQGMVA